MKLALALILTTAALPASARDLAYMPNQAGGEIVLTDLTSETCQVGSTIAYSRGEDGTTITGCWVAGKNYVVIKWTGGSTRMFRYSQFTVFDADEKPAARVPDMRL